MISRIYIDNYKCFTNFEYQPGALQLLLGPNGTGKSAVFEVLELLRGFVIDGTHARSVFASDTATAWDQRREKTVELALKGRGGEYLYRLIIGRERTSQTDRIRTEELRFDDRTLYQFDGRDSRLFRDDGSADSVFPSDGSRSAIPIIPERDDHTLLSWFRWRVDRIVVVSPDPLQMSAHSQEEQSHPDRRLHQLASWIRHLRFESPEISRRVADSLRGGVLDGLVDYKFVDHGEGPCTLKFEFRAPTSDVDRSSRSFSLELDRLSTGQRTLVALYTMLHAAVGPDMTLCIDEPANDVALREIQPWLVELTDKVEDTGGQCLLISHHPELINYLAADRGVRFFREGGGPAKAKPFERSQDERLRPAELVARGWEID